MSGRKVVFLGGTDHFQADPPNGKCYHPGDVVSLSDIERANLHAAGLRFGAVPDDDEPKSEPKPEPPPLEPATVSADAMADTAPAKAPPTADKTKEK